MGNRYHQKLQKSHINLYHYVLFFLLCGIGGTTYAFQKLGLTAGLPLWSAGMRFLIAGILLLSGGCLRKRITFHRQTVMTAIQYGLLYFAAPFGIVYWVGQYLPSGLLSVLSSSVAIFSILFHFLLHGQRTGKRQLWGMALSACGILCIFFNSLFSGYEGTMIGYLIAAIAAYAGAAYATANLKFKVNAIDQYSFNTIALLIGGISLCAASLLLERGIRVFSGIPLVSLLYLALVGSLLATSITTYLMSQWDVAQVTSYRFISPVVSLLVGFVFLSERLTLQELLGAILIMIGTVIIK